MELCYFESHTLDTLKKGLPQTFGKYFTERDNSWLAEVCGENPFRKFKDVDDFELAPLDDGFEPGKIDFDNCKILYSRLSFLTPRQAADERFWAGLCHGTFYGYVRRRYKYDAEENFPTPKEIKTRFFFETISRTGILRNPLAKCWWTGKAFFDSTRTNKFEKLDILGANDISSKISYILRYPFTSNPKILNGIVKFFKHFREANRSLGALKESLRPAIYELNKRGGAVVLDCLTEDEVAAIMIAHVEKNFSRKVVAVTPAKVVDGRTVQLGSTAKLIPLDGGGRPRNYKIGDWLNKNHPHIFDELIGKNIGSTVTIRDGKFIITDIT